MKVSDSYKICTRCVMDTSAAGIVFDDDGICNYCSDFLTRSSDILFQKQAQRDENRNQFLEKVKKEGRDKEYDCVVGVSGGVDSSWALHLVKKEGLRPLAVHMDNGWNSELAVNNIKNLVTRLDVDLFTHVIDWNEYRDMMQAFFDADVIDVELLYDNAMLAVNYQQAAKYGVKYILSGTNSSTEGMTIPPNWNWFKLDKKNIKQIVRRFGNGRSIKSFPFIGTANFVYYKACRNIKWINFLDYYDYVKNDALDYLEQELGYRRYPYKHYESVFTRFYQGYILPEKFRVDKRKVHMSTLIMSKQMTRDEALNDLQLLAYPSEQDCKDDIDYFLKKMGWSYKNLEDYLKREEKPHTDYGTEKENWELILDYYRGLKRILKNSTGLIAQE